MEEPIAGRSVFLPALAQHVWAFSISVSAISIGAALSIDWLRAGLVAFGGCSAVLFFVILAHDFDAQKQLLAAHLARHAVITDSMRPLPPPAPAAPRVPFPPMRFVEFIWSAHDRDGKFPTVDACETAGMNRQLVQAWYQQCVEAGAIVNRIPKQYAGDPVWSREKFERAAMADNTLPVAA